MQSMENNAWWDDEVKEGMPEKNKNQIEELLLQMHEGETKIRMMYSTGSPQPMPGHWAIIQRYNRLPQGYLWPRFNSPKAELSPWLRD